MISVVATSVGYKDTLIKPFIDSFHYYSAPTTEIIVVNQGVDIPVCSRAAALNHGIEQSKGDWIWVLDIDVLATGYYPIHFDDLDPDYVYGNELIKYKRVKHLATGCYWLNGWSMAFHRSVLDRIGYFDEKFQVSGYLEVDWCIRAFNEGHECVEHDFPVVHLATGSRFDIDPEYKSKKAENLLHLESKHGLERWR